MVLRYGDMIFLSTRSADDSNVCLQDILCFARYSLIETVIVAINLSDKNQEFNIDFGPLVPIFREACSNSTVVMVRDCLDSEDNPNSDAEYYFLREFLEERMTRELRPYRSLVLSLSACDDDQYIFKKCLTTSIDRMKHSLANNGSIEHE